MSKLGTVVDCSLSGLAGMSADFPSQRRKPVTARDNLGELVCLKWSEANDCRGWGCYDPERSGPFTASRLLSLKRFQVTA
jgi:hypothetical protein